MRKEHSVLDWIDLTPSAHSNSNPNEGRENFRYSMACKLGGKSIKSSDGFVKLEFTPFGVVRSSTSKKRKCIQSASLHFADKEQNTSGISKTSANEQTLNDDVTLETKFFRRHKLRRLSFGKYEFESTPPSDKDIKASLPYTPIGIKSSEYYSNIIIPSECENKFKTHEIVMGLLRCRIVSQDDLSTDESLIPSHQLFDYNEDS